MERLTRRMNNNKITAIKGSGSNYGAQSFDCQTNDGNDRLRMALEKLADYEDLEEQGLLVRLPCKVGDVLYCIDNGIVETLIVNSFRIYNFNRVEIDFENASGFALCTFAGELDEGYFLSREEAENKLEEMKNDGSKK